MADASFTIEIKAPELSHAILELAGVIAMAISTDAAKFSMAHQAQVEVATSTSTIVAEEVAPPMPAQASAQAEMSIPDIVTLRAAAQEKGKTVEGKAAIKSLLGQFGAKSISDVPDAQKAEFLAALEAL